MLLLLLFLFCNLSWVSWSFLQLRIMIMSDNSGRTLNNASYFFYFSFYNSLIRYIVYFHVFFKPLFIFFYKLILHLAYSYKFSDIFLFSTSTKVKQASLLAVTFCKGGLLLLQVYFAGVALWIFSFM